MSSKFNHLITHTHTKIFLFWRWMTFYCLVYFLYPFTHGYCSCHNLTSASRCNDRGHTDVSLVWQLQFPPPVHSKLQEDHTITRAPYHHPHFRHSGKKSSVYKLGSVTRWSWLSQQRSKSNSRVPQSLQFQGMSLPRIPCGKEPMSTRGRNSQPCLEWLASS